MLPTRHAASSLILPFTQNRKAELARQSRQKKTEKLDLLEQEVSRLRQRLRLYEPYDPTANDDAAFVGAICLMRAHAFLNQRFPSNMPSVFR